MRTLTHQTYSIIRLMIAESQNKAVHEISACREIPFGESVNWFNPTTLCAAIHVYEF